MRGNYPLDVRDSQRDHPAGSEESVVSIKASADEFSDALAELSLFVRKLADVPLEVRRRMAGLLSSLADRFLAFESNYSATGGTGELVVSIKPSKLLSDVLLAVRAGKGDVGTLDKIAQAHGVSSNG